VNSAAENSKKFQKARFWKEKSVEDAWANGRGHTSMNIVTYLFQTEEMFAYHSYMSSKTLLSFTSFHTVDISAPCKMDRTNPS
jgi:hypothetical protein